MDCDRIVAIGDNDMLHSLVRQDTKSLDCQGATVVPGFNDAHCHVLAFARSLMSLDCSPAAVESIEDIKDKVREYARGVPKGSWITCARYNEFNLAERRHPTRHDLDLAAPGHPVKLDHFSGHLCVLNSAGLKAAGITAETPEPEGAIIDRELDTGEPNGLLHEMNYVVDKAIPARSRSDLESAIHRANRSFLSLGITSLQDATADNGYSRWQMFKRLKSSGSLLPRLTVMAGMENVDTFLRHGMYPQSGDDQLRLGAVKAMVTESTGKLFPSQEELNRLVLKVHDAGGQVAIHAIEETTIEAAVVALEYALLRHPRRGHRHRIEHASECPPALLARIKALGAVIVTQPPFVYYGGDRYLVQVPESQRPFLYRFGSFLRNAVVAAASSDSPVVPANPLVGVYAAVTRKSAGGQDLLANEAIPPLEALAMYTTNAAYSSFQEESKGSIAVGKLADLAVLSADPTSVPPEQIRDIKVRVTVLGGKVVWER